MRKLGRTIVIVLLLPSSAPPGGSGHAQTPTDQNLQNRSSARTDTKAKANEAALLRAQRRSFAVSLVMSLADEARSYRDLALRAKVLARAADTLWEVDSDAARSQFRRAWEAAEKADADDAPTPSKDGGPAMLIAFPSMSGGDLRSQVLTLAARRDRALGEEFLKKLTDDTNREAADFARDERTQNNRGSWSAPQAASKRLLLARRLLDEGEIERALEFASPVLNQVNEKTISFLTALRAKKPELADQRFVLLLAQVELDPSSDANTVSGLSSYAFSPGLYLTFNADGGVNLSPAAAPLPGPNLSVSVRKRFFQVAGNILLRPLLPPEQDFTSAGRTGKYMVIKRLLPLFDQYAPDTAVALRSQLAALIATRPSSEGDNDDFLMSQGMQPEVSSAGALENMQERLDHATSSHERDSIYTDTAVVLANQGDARAQDIADRIDHTEWRAVVREFVDVSLVQFAIRKNDALLVARLAKAGVLSHTQRAWAYTQAARLQMKSERRRALDLLEEALGEARRIEADDPNRASMLIGVTIQFLSSDRMRAWEIMGEAVKAANAVAEFSGEDVGLKMALGTSSGLKFIEISGSEFNLERVLRLLAKEDLIRATELAKSFKHDPPRAAAILALASAVFEKSKAETENQF